MGARDISVRQSTSRFKDAAQLGSDSYRGKISLSLSLSLALPVILTKRF